MVVEPLPAEKVLVMNATVGAAAVNDAYVNTANVKIYAVSFGSPNTNRGSQGNSSSGGSH